MARSRPALVACLDGKRAAPPEDCGGGSGYANLLAALADPKHEQHDEILDWVGMPFDPEAFSLRAINEELATLDF